jgi:hypothetical protein
MTSLDPTYRPFGRLPTGEPIEAANAPQLDPCGILLPGATHTTRTAYRFSRETRRGNDGSNG